MLPLPLTRVLSPKSAAEEVCHARIFTSLTLKAISLIIFATHFVIICCVYIQIGYTFLPCVLVGLSKAPQYIVNSRSSDNGCLYAGDVDSVVLPLDACGGDAALAFARSNGKKPLIIAVEENETVLDSTPDKLGIEVCLQMKVSNYWEAIGVIAAHKAGINPYSLRRDRIANIGYRKNSSIRQTNGFTVSIPHS
ncbi:Uncharacterized lipoprotein syc1174_c [Linum perenne]